VKALRITMMYDICNPRINI